MINKSIEEGIKNAYPQFLFLEDSIILNLTSLTLQFAKDYEVGLDHESTNHFFDFVNSFEDTDQDTLSIIEVGVLEILTDTAKSQGIAVQLLKGRLLEKFNLLFKDKFWRL